MFKTFLMSLALTFAPAAVAAPEPTANETTTMNEPAEPECTATKTRYSDITIEACAHAGYELNRAQAVAGGDSSWPGWYGLSQHSRELRREEVRKALSKHGPGDIWAHLVRMLAYDLEPPQAIEARLFKASDLEPVRAPDIAPDTGTPQLYAQIGYEAYAQSTGGKTFDGRDMPTWEALPDRIQRAWTDAATAIRVAT